MAYMNSTFAMLKKAKNIRLSALESTSKCRPIHSFFPKANHCPFHKFCRNSSMTFLNNPAERQNRLVGGSSKEYVTGP